MVQSLYILRQPTVYVSNGTKTQQAHFVTVLQTGISAVAPSGSGKETCNDGNRYRAANSSLWHELVSDTPEDVVPRLVLALALPSFTIGPASV
jgi:hypothetical protein